MSTKPKYAITLEDRQNAQRLRKIWDKNKTELGLTQVKAAKILGITQPALNQYLNTIMPLNTNIIFKFAALLKVHPIDIAPSMKNVTPLFALVNVHTAKRMIPILGSTSGRQTVHKKELSLDSALSTIPTLAGFIVDDNQYRDSLGYPKGAVLLVDLLDAEPAPERLFLLQIENIPGALVVRIDKVFKETLHISDFSMTLEETIIPRSAILNMYHLHSVNLAGK
jgi:transcriptional regulator with XRE-family HTH domain